MNLRSQRGFTLVETLTVLALIAILIGAVLIAINPARQFANARNTTRQSHLNTLGNAIAANSSENDGVFTCVTGTLPATATEMTAEVGGYDIGPCLSPDYLPSVPFDPSDTTGSWTSTTDYATGYTVLQDANGNITIAAPLAELSAVISITR